MQPNQGLQPVETLFKMCIVQIVNNIKTFGEFTGVYDGYILESIMTELKKRKLLNNTNLKLFLVPELEHLELTGDLFVR